MASYETDEQVEEQGGGMPSLADMLRLLRKRARLIALATFCCGSLATTFAFLATPMFESSAAVMVEPREKKIMEMQEVVGSIGGDTATIESEVEILKSSTIAGRVIDDMRLDSDPEFNSGSLITVLARRVRALLGLPGAGPGWSSADAPASTASNAPPLVVEDAGDAFFTFANRLGVQRVRNTYLIEISFESSNPDKAARIANSVAETYLQQQVESKMKVAELATVWLDRRVAELREKVFDAERLVEEYKTKNGLIDSEGHPLDEKQLARAMEQLILARATTAQARAKYEQAQALIATDGGRESVGDVLQSPTITRLKEEFAKTTRTVAELETKYGPMHPAMLKAKAEERDARRQLDAEIDRIVTNLETEFEVARDREASLQQSLDGLKSEKGTAEKASVRLAELDRDAAAARSVYESFLKRAEEMKQQQNLQLPDARIVQYAIPAGRPHSPKRLQLMVLGVAGGLGLGLALAFALELMFPASVRPEKIERALRLRHLASLPLTLSTGETDIAGGISQIRRIVIEPRSSFAEAIRSIRVGLESVRRIGGCQVVQVVSSLPGEGKTVIASNLAHHYALSGARTLLIDADLRKGALTRAFMPEAQTGLRECLVDGEPAMPSVVVETSTGLRFLPAQGGEVGEVPAAELVGSPQMVDVMAELRAEFDVIVVDCPPVMPVVDARLIADLVDQIVFVYKWRTTAKPIAKRAIHNLAANEPKIAGVVVNGVDEIELSAMQGYLDERPMPEPLAA